MKPCKDGSIIVGDEQEVQVKEKGNKISTVNVLEMFMGSPREIISFKDNSKGNIEAERLFSKMAGNNGAKTEELDSYIEDGVYDDPEADYAIYIIHS